MDKKKRNQFPTVVNDFLGNLTLKEISIGRSGDKVYELFGINSFVLKVSSNVKLLEYEKDIFKWLNDSNKLPVPEVVFWYKDQDKGYLITKKIRGKMLCDNYFIKRPKQLIKIIKDAIELVSSVNIKDFPFKEKIDINNKVFSHGDLCLPNIIVRNNKIVGFLDLGDAAIRDKEYDVATILRSYEYNINTLKYSEELINNIDNIDKDKVLEYYPIVFG